MAYPVFAPNTTWYKGATKRASITEINIVDSYTPIGNETELWNADSGDTGSIKCYVTGTVLTIAGDGSGMLAMNADASWMFSDSTKKDYFKNVVNINGTELLDTSNATTFMRLFQSCEKLAYVNVANWDTHNVTTMHTTFSQCYALDGIDVSNWDVSNVTNMRSIFQVCKSLRHLDLSKWDVSNVTDMFGIFMSTESLGSMALMSVGDISNWDTSKVTTMASIFQSCGSITHIPNLRWNTSNVTDFSCMFQHAKSLKRVDLSTFDTRKATKMNDFFNGATALERISVGKNFLVAGDGTGTAAVIPTPDPAFIEGADGYWYDVNGMLYTAAIIGQGGARTYYASKSLIDKAFTINCKTMSSLANVVRSVTGTIYPMTIDGMIEALESAKPTTEEWVVTYEDGTTRNVEVYTT